MIINPEFWWKKDTDWPQECGLEDVVWNDIEGIISMLAQRSNKAFSWFIREEKIGNYIIDWGDLTRCGYERQIQRKKINGPSNKYRADWTRYPYVKIVPGFDHSLINREVVDPSWRPIFKLVQTLELWREGLACYRHWNVSRGSCIIMARPWPLIKNFYLGIFCN